MAHAPVEHAICILVASPDSAERLGLVTIIAAQTDMEIGGQSESLQELLDPAAPLGPDVFLADTGLIDSEAAAAIEQYLERHNSCRFLLVAMHAEDGGIARAMRAGARGYVLKGMAHQELIAAIRLVVAGGFYRPGWSHATEVSEDAPRSMPLCPEK